MSLSESFNGITGPASNVLALAATALMARHSLRRYLTFLQLLPPPPPTSAELTQSKAKEDTEVQVKGWRRFFTKRALKAYRQFALMMFIQFGIAFGLPRLANKAVMDVIWTAIPMFLMFFSAGAGSLYLYPSPEELSLERKDPKSGLSLKTTDQPTGKYTEHLRTAFAVVLTATTMASAYYGFKLPQALMAGLFTLIACNLRFPKMRTMIKFFTGAIVAVPVLTMIIVPICEYYFGKEPPNSPKRGVVLPEKWLLDLAVFPTYGMGMMMPSTLLAMTYRYEYSKSSSPPPRLSTPVPVVRHFTPFNHPIYSSGFIALVTSLFGGDHIMRTYAPSLISGNDGMGIFAMFVCTPAVLLVVGLKAWMKSELRDWWMYEEGWVPSKTEAEAILEDYAEKGVEKKEFVDDAEVVEGMM